MGTLKPTKYSPASDHHLESERSNKNVTESDHSDSGVSDLEINYDQLQNSYDKELEETLCLEDETINITAHGEQNLIEIMYQIESENRKLIVLLKFMSKHHLLNHFLQIV